MTKWTKQKKIISITKIVLLLNFLLSVLSGSTLIFYYIVFSDVFSKSINTLVYKACGGVLTVCVFVLIVSLAWVVFIEEILND